MTQRLDTCATQYWRARVSSVKEEALRISELATAVDLPVATVKYYLRERVLHEGRLTSATQAQYDGSHVERLRLVRALMSAGLSIATIRTLLAELEHPPDDLYSVLGLAHQTVTPHPPEGVDTSAIDQQLERWGWDPQQCAPDARAALASALGVLADAGFDLPAELLDRYAASMRQVADAEVANTPLTSPADAARYVVMGTVLVEPVLLALRRLAQQDASAERFGGASGGSTATRPAVPTLGV
jgi:DNA-binding transcriptional MerR regulator